MTNIRKSICSLMIALFFVFLAVCLSSDCAAVQSGDAGLEIFYYYYNPCESCDEFNRYAGFLGSLFREDAIEFYYNIYGVNGFYDNNSSFTKICDTIGISHEERRQPMLVCGRHWLADGVDDARILEAFLSACAADSELYTGSNSSESTREAQAVLDLAAYPGLDNLDPDNSVLLLFTTDACAKCDDAKAYLHNLTGEWNSVVNGRSVVSKVRVIEFSLTQEGIPDLVNTLFKQFDVPASDRKVPIVFYSGGYISGLTAIERKVTGVLDRGEALGFSIEGIRSSAASISWRDIPAIFIAGLIGSFNPCSISMLLFLISLLAARQVNVLKFGFVFIVARMVAYFLVGTVLSSLLVYMDTLFVSIAWVADIIIAAVLLILSGISVYDFFKARDEKYGDIRLQLPRGLRKVNHLLIEKTAGRAEGILYGAVFLLGLFISMGEFLCTGQIYLATIVYLLDKATSFTAELCALLGTYVIAASILPTVLTVLIHRGKRVVLLSETLRRNIPIAKLINGVFFLLIAIFLIVGIL